MQEHLCVFSCSATALLFVVWWKSGATSWLTSTSVQQDKLVAQLKLGPHAATLEKCVASSTHTRRHVNVNAASARPLCMVHLLIY